MEYFKNSVESTEQSLIHSKASKNGDEPDSEGFKVHGQK